MELQKEAWKLVEEWRLAAKEERSYRNFDAAAMLQACASDLEDILVEDAKITNWLYRENPTMIDNT